jgi:murein DD-endopeptidase MepM/ murein hydrolase activator NlpD
VRRDPISGIVLECHDGVDYSAEIGSEIFAVAKGVATEKSNPSGFGTYVQIDHGLGVFTLYGHMSSVIKTGSVNEGDLIGLSGNTGGRTTGPHLHFSIYLTSGINSGPYPLFKGGVYNCEASVDPLSFIWTEN